MCLIKEIWKDIPEYEGLYQVSNFGRVKSLKRGKENILKHIKTKDGYFFINLYQNGKQKNFKVHQLVARMFIPNPYNLPIINHKDENKQNNHVSNLEWCTIHYNNCYGTRNKRISIAHKGKRNKPILQFSLEGEFIREWDSAKSVNIKLNINSGHISECCKGKLKTCSGFIWKYKE